MTSKVITEDTSSSPILKSNTSKTTNTANAKPTTTSSLPLKIKKYRDPLSPKPILDRHLLTEELESRSILLKDGQLDTFYQLLHRQHYPNLSDFVKEYYRNEGDNSKSSSSSNNKGSSDRQQQQQRLPLKNKINQSKNLRQLPKPFLDFLSSPNSDFVTMTTKIQTAHTSSDGTTTKLGVELQDGHVIESVIMRHVSPEGSRATLCVSSQVGCAMGCTFCATGTMGIRGNLTSGEILEQLVHAGKILAAESLDMKNNDAMLTATSSKTNDAAAAGGGVRDKTRTNKQKKNNTQQESSKNLSLVRNIVFMGMGEPLNNYKNVLEACRAMLNRKRWNLSAKHVTVSTVGVIPKMKKLTEDIPEVSLALSLHAPNQKMRTDIVPTAKNYPIEGLIQALDDHMMALTKTDDDFRRRKNGTVVVGSEKQSQDEGEEKIVYNAEQRKSASKKKRAMIEYVMLKGDTSTFECAHQLGKLCENRLLIVNLIPYNQTDVKDKLSCPSEEHMREFQRIVTSYGVFCFIRRTMGADIAGACGQLVVEQESKMISSSILGGGGEEEELEVDIEDGPFVGQKKKVASTSLSVSAVGKERRLKRSMGSLLPSSSSSSSSSTQQNDNKITTVDTVNGDDKDDSNAANNDVEKWIRPLTIATGIAASCFILSSALFLLQRNGHRRK